jgi:uncharacterized RDD family membrane protein YckC
MDQPPAQPPTQPEGQPFPPAPPAPPAPTYAVPAEGAPPAVPPPAAPAGYAWTTPVEPAGPAPGVRFAGHGGRLVAYIVDSIILSVVATVVAIALGVLTAAFASAGSDALAVLSGIGIFVALLAVSLGYFPWFWARGGATPGMRLFRLRVVRDADGGPISGGQAILRLIGFWVSSFVLYLGFIWILIDSRRRGWHDLIAGTVVIELDR